jgi:hypothetical protein
LEETGEEGTIRRKWIGKVYRPMATPRSEGGVASERASERGQAESGGIVLATCWPRVPRGGVTRQGVALTDLQSLDDRQ